MEWNIFKDGIGPGIVWIVVLLMTCVLPVFIYLDVPLIIKTGEELRAFTHLEKGIFFMGLLYGVVVTSRFI